MPIEFKCPNGHTIQAKDTMAGKTANCPGCGVSVKIPPAEKVTLTEDAILGILGPAPANSDDLPSEGFADAFTGNAEPFESATARRKLCPQCRAQIETETHICPNCSHYIAGLKDFAPEK